MLRTILLTMTVLAMFGATTLAQEAQVQPAGEPAPQPAAGNAPADEQAVAEALEALVVEVSGAVSRRDATDEKGGWAPVKQGDKLGEMTLVRTGLNSKLVIHFADRAQLTVTLPTKFGIRQFATDGQTVAADLGMKYGAIAAKVDAGKGKNHFEVETPEATLAVKGSGANTGVFGGFGTNVQNTSGTWNFNPNGAPGGDLQEGQGSDGDGTPPGDTFANNRDTQMGDPNGGTQGTEQDNLRDHGGGLGVINFNGAAGTLNPTGAGNIPTGEHSPNGSYDNGGYSIEGGE